MADITFYNPQMPYYDPMHDLPVNEHDLAAHPSAKNVVKPFAKPVRLGDPKVTVVA